jgi:hypothetical protein
MGDKVFLLATDKHHDYARLGERFILEYVKHSAKQYVVGAIHMDAISGVLEPD